MNLAIRINKVLKLNKHGLCKLLTFKPIFDSKSSIIHLNRRLINTSVPSPITTTTAIFYSKSKKTE